MEDVVAIRKRMVKVYNEMRRLVELQRVNAEEARVAEAATEYYAELEKIIGRQLRAIQAGDLVDLYIYRETRDRYRVALGESQDAALIELQLVAVAQNLAECQTRLKTNYQFLGNQLDVVKTKSNVLPFRL